MPLEIRELVIRTTIDAGPAPAAAGAGPATGNGAPSHAAEGPSEELIAACVEQVLQILKDREER